MKKRYYYIEKCMKYRITCNWYSREVFAIPCVFANDSMFQYINATI